jgi:hypothetical protein
VSVDDVDQARRVQSETPANAKQLLFCYAFALHSTNIFIQYLANGEPGLTSPESRGHVRDQCACAVREHGVLAQMPLFYTL